MSGRQLLFFGLVLSACSAPVEDSDVLGDPEVDIDGRWIVEDGRFPWQEAGWADEIDAEWGDLQTLDGSVADCWEGPVEEPQQALHHGPEYSGDRFEHWVSFVADFPCGEGASATRIQGERDLGTPILDRVEDGVDTYRLNDEEWSFRAVEPGVLELEVSGAVLTLRQAG